MCGRFTLSADEETLAAAFDLPSLAAALPPRFNIAPSQRVPVIRLNSHGQRQLHLVYWGLIPSWTKHPRAGNHPINARAETVASKPTFRQAWRQRRCLIAADGFYEWRREGRTKQPFLIRQRGGAPFAFAGLWERWVDPHGTRVDSCAIITTSPNRLVAQLHDRMPVIIDPRHFARWLQRDEPDIESLRQLLVAIPAERLVAFPVGPQVNSTATDEPNCVRPIGPQLDLPLDD